MSNIYQLARAPGSISLTPEDGTTAGFYVSLQGNPTSDPQHFSSDEFKITGAPPPLTLELIVPDSVQAGQALTIGKTISGGTPPYSIKNAWVQISESGQYLKRVALPNDSLTFTPSYGDSGEVTLTVEDAKGRTAIEYKKFSITGAQVEPLVCHISFNAEELHPSEDLQVSWEIFGGRPPYTRVYGGFVGEAHQDYNTDEMHSFMIGAPEHTNICTFTLTITDSDGRRGQFFSPPLKILNRRFAYTFTPNKAKVGETVQLNLAPADSSDTASYTYQITWKQSGPNGASHSSQVQGSGKCSATFVPHMEGDWAVSIAAVKDGQEVALDKFAYPVVGDQSPLVSGLWVDKTVVNKDQNILAKWNPSGGLGTLKVVRAYWRVEEEGSDWGAQEYAVSKENLLAREASFAPLLGTKGSINLIIRDELGRELAQSMPFAITGTQPYQQMEAKAAVNKEHVEAGGQISANWTVTGGLPPYSYHPEWAIYDQFNDYYLLTPAAAGTSSTITVPKGQYGDFSLIITDAAGFEVGGYAEEFKILPAADGIKGDANDNNKLDLGDALVVLGHLLNQQGLPSFAHADINSDGLVDLKDLELIIQSLVY